jgi:4-hydroxy-3-polyprenylbenzoate decarboxylase
MSIDKSGNTTKTITLAITGASGAQYGLRLLEQLLEAECNVYLMISKAAEVVINQETKYTLPDSFESQKVWFYKTFNSNAQQLKIFGREDWFAPVASGSGAAEAMVVCPASGGTLSALATGASNNLIERAGDVALKERRQLILVPREAPYSQIHLENMLKLTQMGAIVLPASPGFYQAPKCIDDLVDFVVARIMEQLKIPHTLMPKWGN